jgi:hypothetical protein
MVAPQQFRPVSAVQYSTVGHGSPEHCWRVSSSSSSSSSSAAAAAAAAAATWVARQEGWMDIQKDDEVQPP